MRDPVGAIQAVRHVETIDDFLRSGRAMNWRRFRSCAIDPGHQQQLAKPINVIGVQMREVNRVEPGHRKSHGTEIANSARPDIKNVSPLAGEHTDARPGARRVRHRRAGPAEIDMQTIW